MLSSCLFRTFVMSCIVGSSTLACAIEFDAERELRKIEGEWSGAWLLGQEVFGNCTFKVEKTTQRGRGRYVLIKNGAELNRGEIYVGDSGSRGVEYYFLSNFSDGKWDQETTMALDYGSGRNGTLGPDARLHSYGKDGSFYLYKHISGPLIDERIAWSRAFGKPFGVAAMIGWLVCLVLDLFDPKGRTDVIYVSKAEYAEMERRDRERAAEDAQNRERNAEERRASDARVRAEDDRRAEDSRRAAEAERNRQTPPGGY